MKLSAKWFLWFTGIGIYVMLLGAIFYYNLFKWTFDEKLKQEAINMVRLYTPDLIKGLSRNQSVISMDEYDTVTRIAKDERVASLVYLNKFGEIRWYKDAGKITEPWDQFQKEVPPPTDAIEQALLTRSPVVRAVPNVPLYDIAIPLALRGEIMGILNLQISREGVVAVINKAMAKYAIGAVGVLFLMGIPLYFFLHHFVLNPLWGLRDSIEAISFKSLELKFPPRKDEIGELANALTAFLGKVHTSIKDSLAKEKKRGAAEAHWWETILKAVVTKSHQAIIVDEDNSVLYTNFPLNGTATSADGKMHLLDVIDAQQQDVLRLVGVAIDRPNEVREIDTTFRAEPYHVRAVHLKEDNDQGRTLILFEPKKAAR